MQDMGRYVSNSDMPRKCRAYGFILVVSPLLIFILSIVALTSLLCHNICMRSFRSEQWTERVVDSTCSFCCSVIVISSINGLAGM